MRFSTYIWKSSRAQLSLTLILLIIFVILFINSWAHSMKLAAMWQNWMEVLFAFGTIGIAAFIWWNEKKGDWENNLPKRLDVRFVCSNQDPENPVFTVDNAPLTGSAEVRQWGQQIGRQRNGGKDLSFSGFKVEVPQHEYSNGEDIMKYKLTVWLQAPPDAKEPKTWKYDNDGKLIQNNEKFESISTHPASQSAKQTSP